MSTFTTIADLERLTDRELHIMFRTVTERLATYDKARRSAAKRWPRSP